MRPVRQTITAAGGGNPVVTDQRRSVFNVGVSVHVIGTATFGVQYTLDDPFQVNGLATATWFNATGLGGSADVSGQINIPCTAVRCNVTAATGGGVQFNYLQTGDGP